MLLLFIVIIVVIVIIANNQKNNYSEKKSGQIVGYNTATGAPIYLSECRLIGYNTQNGNAIYENPYDIKEYDTSTGKPIFNTIEVPNPNNNQSLSTQPSLNSQNDIKVPHKEPKKPLTEEEKNRLSNSILMITGAVLIVIASIIFLASSWDTVHSLIKVLVLVGIQIIFFIFAFICQKKLNIVKVSKVFKYLGYIFVPINLLSLSCFNLIGNYFSIDGDGFFLYFALTFLVTDILYKIIGNFKKDTILKQISYFTEILTLLFLCIHFEIMIAYTFVILSLYNNIMSLLLAKNILDSKAYNKINQVTSYIILFLLVIRIIYNNETIYCLSTCIYAIGYFIKYITSSDENSKKTNIILFLITYIFTLMILKNIKITPYFIYLLALVPLVKLISLMKNEKTKNTAYNVLVVISFIILLIAIDNPDKSIFYLLTFISALILYIILGLITKNRLYKTLSYLLFTALFVNIFYITNLMQYAKYFPIIIVTLAYCLELLFPELKDQYSKLYFIAIPLIESIILINTYFVLAPLLFMVILVKVDKLDEKLLILPMLTSLSLFTMNDNNITKILSYCLIAIYTALSLFHKKINVYTIISLIAIALSCIVFKYNLFVLFGLTLIWSIIHIFVNYKESNKLFKFTTIISVLGLYSKTLNFFDIPSYSLYGLGFYIALITITTFLLRQDNKDTHFFECFGFSIISIVSIVLIKDVKDGLILTFILFLLSLTSFIKKWRFYLYCSLIFMILSIIYLTSAFWSLIPWYVYILLIGLGLIVFAMFDEHRKMNKKANLNQISTNNDSSVDNEQPSLETPAVSSNDMTEKKPRRGRKVKEAQITTVKKD